MTIGLESVAHAPRNLLPKMNRAGGEAVDVFGRFPELGVFGTEAGHAVAADQTGEDFRGRFLAIDGSEPILPIAATTHAGMPTGPVQVAELGRSCGAPGPLFAMPSALAK